MRTEVQERFLEFVDCNKKTGQNKEIKAKFIHHKLRKHHASLSNCHEQGFDNGSNMQYIHSLMVWKFHKNVMVYWQGCANSFTQR